MKRIQKSQNKLEDADFKIYFKATVSKTVWFPHIYKQINGQNHKYMERKDLDIHGQLIFRKGCQGNGKEQYFQNMVLKQICRKTSPQQLP